MNFSFPNRFQTLWMAAAISITTLSACPKRVPLEKYDTVPKFELISEQGLAFGSENLKGKPWVANFVFTRCPSICPAFSAKMAGIQKRTSDLKELHLVSFSVDPEFDQPAVLKNYAQTYKADPERWTFLTGPRKSIEEVVIGSMKMPMDKGDGKNLMTVAHGSYFVLVDKNLQIRAFYQYDDPQVVEKLHHDATNLLKE